MNVLGLSIPDGYEIPFIFTLIIMAVKLSLILFIAYKIVKKRKEKIRRASPGVLFWITCLLISRILYTIFDYFLTKFDTSTYVDFPNLWYWKTASLLLAIGVAVLLIFIDRRVLHNKFKGIFGIIIIIAGAVQFFYPVHDLQEFAIASGIGTAADFCAFFIPILFIWIAIKTPELRKISLAVAIGAIVYVVGGTLVSPTFINLLGLTQDIMYAIDTILKTIGLVMISYGAMHFAA